MGSRMLRSWIEQPLISKEEIERRLDAVSTLKDAPMLLDGLADALNAVYDVERLLSRIAYETVNPHDCLSLLRSLKAVPGIRELLSGQCGLLADTCAKLDPMETLAEEIDRAISEDAPADHPRGRHL